MTRKTTTPTNTPTPNRFRPGRRGRALLAGVAGAGVLVTGLALAPQANAAEPTQAQSPSQQHPVGCSGTCSETFKVGDFMKDLTMTLVDKGSPAYGWVSSPKLGSKLDPIHPGTDVWDMAYDPFVEGSTADVTYALTDSKGQSHGTVVITMATNFVGRGTVPSCVSNDSTVTCDWEHEGNLGFGTVDIYLKQK